MAMKPLIIFDLNGSLVRRSKTHIYLRPHLADLLQFCFDHFAVAIWTSSEQRNMQRMVDAAFHDKHLEFCWDRSVTLKDPTGPIAASLKNLQIVWEQFSQWGPNNTILIDDSPSKARLCPHNCALVREWSNEDVNSDSDDDLLALKEYLEWLVDENDFRDFITNHPFHSTEMTKEMLSDVISASEVAQLPFSKQSARTVSVTQAQPATEALIAAANAAMDEWSKKSNSATRKYIKRYACTRPFLSICLAI